MVRQLKGAVRSGNGAQFLATTVRETEAELRLYFLRKIKEAGIPIRRSRVLVNIYDGQVKKIKSAVSKLHEDLQFDYGVELEGL